MPRPLTIAQDEFPYSVTGRCINRDWFGMSLDRVWNIMSEELYLSHIMYEIRIHSFVLMSNHFHLTISTPQMNLSQAMQRFMKQTSLRITKPLGRINQTYGARHKPCVLDSANYILNTYKYNYRNPIAAGLAQRVEDWPYSTLHGLLGMSRLLIPVAEDHNLFDDPEGTLRWLNERPKSEHIEAMKYALRHQRFTLRNDVDTKREHYLEKFLL